MAVRSGPIVDWGQTIDLGLFRRVIIVLDLLIIMMRFWRRDLITLLCLILMSIGVLAMKRSRVYRWVVFCYRGSVA